MGALADAAKAVSRQVSGQSPGQPPVQNVPGGTSGSYVGQNNGGVSNPGQSLLGIVAGQSNVHVDPALQSSLPDAGDQAAAQAATAEYNQMYADWQQKIKDAIAQANASGDPFKARDIYDKVIKPLQDNPPAKPDYLAIQNQSDRNRLLNEATSAYTPLIAALGTASQGKGPSQALDQYKIAADDAQRRTLGAAASFQGTGGQRAATFQSALQTVAQQQQQAAGQAAAIGATEQQNARASLGSALAGLTNVYGTQLYGGTQAQQGANQNAQNNAIALNAKIQQNNSDNATGLAKTVIGSAAQAAGAA